MSPRLRAIGTVFGVLSNRDMVGVVMNCLPEGLRFLTPSLGGEAMIEMWTLSALEPVHDHHFSAPSAKTRIVE